jgi:hypothetical protein
MMEGFAEVPDELPLGCEGVRHGANAAKEKAQKIILTN